jgi:hypothetical protein
MEQNIKQKFTRQFGGKTEFILTQIDTTNAETIAKTTEQREADKTERHFHQRMLRAYLKGKEYFHFGFTYKYGGRQPESHKVLVNYV